MIVDSSAIVAILRAESDARQYAEALEAAPSRRISAANWLESAIVISDPSEPVTGRRFNEFVREAALRVEPVTAKQASIARDAYRDFGKGSGHPAQLNFGDCFAYALAAETGEPLLFKGNDFSQTDLRSALAAGKTGND
jgi:ribonuclease VapC